MLSSGACHIPQRRLALLPAHPVGVHGQGPQNTGVQAPTFSNHLAFRVGPGCTPPEVSGQETRYCNTRENRLLGSYTWGISSGPDAQGERLAPSNRLNKLSALLLWIHSNFTVSTSASPHSCGDRYGQGEPLTRSSLWTQHTTLQGPVVLFSFSTCFQLLNVVPLVLNALADLWPFTLVFIGFEER